MCEQMERLQNTAKTEQDLKHARNLKNMGMSEKDIAKVLETDVSQVKELLESKEMKS